MNQDEQPRAPAASGERGIRYGDVFTVGGYLADKPIAPQDAATMQSAESFVLGRQLRAGPASVMQSAATRNEQMGIVGHKEATEATTEQGVTVAETQVPGARIVTEFIARQPVGQYIAPDYTTGGGLGGGGGGGVVDGKKITIGEALEATVFSAGDQPVEHRDAAAIKAAEKRATGLNATLPGGLAAQAQEAADANAQAAHDEDKTTLRDVLSDATVKLAADKQVEREDAARVVGAEVRSTPDATARPGGVAASIAAAARLNRGRQ